MELASDFLKSRFRYVRSKKDNVLFFRCAYRVSEAFNPANANIKSGHDVFTMINSYAGYSAADKCFYIETLYTLGIDENFYLPGLHYVVRRLDYEI